LYRYTLTDLGIERARQYLEVSQYVGPAPVALSQYEAMMRDQTVLSVHLNRDALERGLGHLILSQDCIDQVGEAVNSGKPLFLYGLPGNGKTVIAEAIGDMLGNVAGGNVFIPYAVEVDNQIIQIYDPVTHIAAEDISADSYDEGLSGLGADGDHDARWVNCNRPLVFVGGELTLKMLDLSFDPISKYYEAPPQVKANGGVFIIDDFGRQLVRPRDLLNRWIVPLEKGVDYLTLHTGKKFRVPFDTIVVFATNIEPQKLVDEAFLRRIRNKIYIDNPTFEAYSQIFRRLCEAKGIPFDIRSLEYLYNNYYQKHGIDLRSCHPRDIIEQLSSIAKYLQIPATLDPALLDRACRNYFLTDEQHRARTGAWRPETRGSESRSDSEFDH
jgi:predicted ATPase with chaperone activity